MDVIWIEIVTTQFICESTAMATQEENEATTWATKYEILQPSLGLSLAASGQNRPSGMGHLWNLLRSIGHFWWVPKFLVQ